MAPSQPRRITGDERRELIALAAGRLFATHGYAGTRMEDVAAAAHVTKPMVYRHFASKKDLYLALLARHEQDLPSFIEGIAESSADLSGDSLVRPILEVWLDYVRSNSHAWAMLFRDTVRRCRDSGLSAAGEPDRTVGDGEVHRRARRLSDAADQVEPTAELLTSGLAGLAQWWIDRPEVPKSVVLDVAVRMSAPAVS